MKQLLLQSQWECLPEMGDGSGFGKQLCWLELSRRFVMSGEGGDGQQTTYYSLVTEEGLFPQLHLSLSKYQTLMSQSEHTFITADADVSLNHTFTCCACLACMTL